MQTDNQELNKIFTVTELIKEWTARGREKELYKFVVDTIEKPLIEMVLERTEGNQLRAARILGINRNTLHSKIKKFNIDAARFKQY